MKIRPSDTPSGVSSVVARATTENQPGLSVVTNNSQSTNNDAAKVSVAQQGASEPSTASPERLKALQSQIEAGTYRPNIEDVAKKIAVELL